MSEVDYNDENYDYTKYWNGRDYENSAEFVALKKFLPEKYEVEKSVLDIGGGFGRLIPVLKDSFGSITVVDYSQRLLDIASQTSVQAGVSIKTIKCDINLLSDIVVEKYDCAVMVRVSHHLKDLESVFKQVHGILNDRGIFILEIANKMHFKSIILNLVKGNFKYFSKESVSIASKDVTFLNHHPKNVESLLEKAGFKIEKKLSVSNFRLAILKKIFPVKFLLLIENYVQELLSIVYFGPSIFYKSIKE